MIKIVLLFGTFSYIRQFFLYESNCRILGDRTGSIGRSVVIINKNSGAIGIQAANAFC